ncbi:MAG: diaminopimelate epimerase [bacterium]|nr:diaminopimelate epimerase [bacterium]
MTSSSLCFWKLQGAGNDFVLLDLLRQPLPMDDWAALARRLCDRRFGVGADGVLLVESSERAAYRMRILNADGSEASMCGNGIRCFAHYLWWHYALPNDVLAIETLAGVRHVHRVAQGRITVEMGPPRTLDHPPTLPHEVQSVLRRYTANATASVAVLDTGAPHLVLLVHHVEQFPLEVVGPVLEGYYPGRVNVSAAQVERGDCVRARVWERGAGATLACGTGACAILVAGARQGLLERRATVQMPGGALQVEWRDDDTLWLTGDAELVFEGVWHKPL